MLLRDEGAPPPPPRLNFVSPPLLCVRVRAPCRVSPRFITLHPLTTLPRGICLFLLACLLSDSSRDSTKWPKLVPKSVVIVEISIFFCDFRYFFGYSREDGGFQSAVPARSFLPGCQHCLSLPFLHAVYVDLKVARFLLSLIPGKANGSIRTGKSGRYRSRFGLRSLLDPLSRCQRQSVSG